MLRLQGRQVCSANNSGGIMARSRIHALKPWLLTSSATVSLFFGADAALAAQPAAQPRVSTDEIVITGTRRTDRTVTTSASPIDVISSTELTNQPTANLLDTVKNIVPSFYVGQNTISDASSFVRAPSLRGLPGDE